MTPRRLAPVGVALAFVLLAAPGRASEVAPASAASAASAFTIGVLADGHARYIDEVRATFEPRFST